MSPGVLPSGDRLTGWRTGTVEAGRLHIYVMETTAARQPRVTIQQERALELVLSDHARVQCLLSILASRAPLAMTLNFLHGPASLCNSCLFAVRSLTEATLAGNAQHVRGPLCRSGKHCLEAAAGAIRSLAPVEFGFASSSDAPGPPELPHWSSGSFGSSPEMSSLADLSPIYMKCQDAVASIPGHRVFLPRLRSPRIMLAGAGGILLIKLSVTHP